MPNLTINFAPMTIGGETNVIIGRQPFDKDRLAELRADFADTHVFRRDGKENVIVDIPIESGQEPIGNVQEEIDLRKHDRLWPELLRASLIRTFNGKRPIMSAYPIAIVGSPKQNLAHHSDLPDWIQKRTMLQFDTRRIKVNDRTFHTGITCETRLKSFINATCEILLSVGIPLLGRYVQIEEPNRDARLMPRRRLVGRVSSVEGGTLILEDHREGFATVLASEVYLEPRREVFDDCILKLLGRRGQQVIEAANSKAEQFNAGPGRKAHIEQALKFLREHSAFPVPGAKFGIGELLHSGSDKFPPIELLDKPILVFDPSGSRKDDWNERGLRKSGPYDQRTFTPKRLRIAVICQDRFEGQVDAFVAKFLDGMPDTLTGVGDRKTARYGDGFLRRFALEKPTVDFFLTNGATSSDYVNASRTALGKASDEGFKYDLAIVQVEEEFKAIDDESNPYYATKSLFLKREVPVQSVRLETMSQRGGELVYSMNHMSLATYAKLGGIPWLLASTQTTAHELVIGLGSHTTMSGRMGSQQRYVGITTVFTSDGSYLLSDRTSAVPYENYASELYETLKRTVETVKRQDNWRATDKVRLVFHMFKPLKDLEVEAIENTVKDLKIDDVTFAFLHIAPDHPYLIFDDDQKGVGYSEPKKGILGPSRRLHLRLGDYESLVVFSGASELKQASDGLPRPALLKLHHRSTFKDMTYLARQAFEFSGHSWRMLSPEPYPITIRYSDLIAERLAGLGNVPGWDDDAIKLGPMGRRLWYL